MDRIHQVTEHREGDRSPVPGAQWAPNGGHPLHVTSMYDHVALVRMPGTGYLHSVGGDLSSDWIPESCGSLIPNVHWGIRKLTFRNFFCQGHLTDLSAGNREHIIRESL